jgi:hypothetical protein
VPTSQHQWKPGITYWFESAGDAFVNAVQIEVCGSGWEGRERGIFGAGWDWHHDLAAGKTASVTARLTLARVDVEKAEIKQTVAVWVGQMQRLSGEVKCKAESQLEVENLGDPSYSSKRAPRFARRLIPQIYVDSTTGMHFSARDKLPSGGVDRP